MAFTATNLAALIEGNGFTLWRYSTVDTRATVSTAGYFAPVAGALRPGDLMVLQTADAVALLPIRIGPALGTGVTLDGVVGAINTVRTIGQRFSITGTCAAVVRTMVLAPLVAGIVAGSTIPVSATVTGPVAQVVFSLRDGSGSLIPPALTVPVTAGTATATFPAPPVGSGYRIRAEDAANAALSAQTPAFTVSPDLQVLLLQAGGRLLLESGAGALKA